MFTTPTLLGATTDAPAPEASPPAQLRRPWTISASSAAAAPEHAAGPSTVSKEFFQQFLAPANNEDVVDWLNMLWVE
ncbi:unnamed protein product [Closterium sp. NIES-64]|nr:unnamed protein product [Closterium sp. NIES-64]